MRNFLNSLEPTEAPKTLMQQFLGVFAYSRRAMVLVWQTSPRLTYLLGGLTLIAGLLPALIAYVGKLIVDQVIASSEYYQQWLQFDSADSTWLLWLLLIEAILVIGLVGVQRGISAVQSLLRALLGHRVNVMILEKAQTLSLAQFEDSEFYDKLVRARREASSRPLALVNKTFGLLQNAIALAGFSVLLWQFSPWVIVMLFVAALPGFLAEAKFSGQAFRLFRWRSPESRKQNYLETLLAREDSVKEIKLFGLGKLFLNRYKAIFDGLYHEDRSLTLRRDGWGFVMSVIASATFYAAYLWVVFDTVTAVITLGAMTMYLVVFKQGQGAITASLTSISGMYEDNLYVSNLYEYLEQPGEEFNGGKKAGSQPQDGIRFENVSFSYKGSSQLALDAVSFHLPAGHSLAIVGENGSGKTTLIKLMSRLYQPTSGRILFDGTDINEWDGEALRAHIGVIFQDFLRYQFTVGENLGVGQLSVFDDKASWQQAAEKGGAADFIDRLPAAYNTQLGRWFKGGQELSGGQWQKLALSRALIRQDADILILDEPTAAMDAQAEADIFNRFKEASTGKTVVLISHRFSTVRMANEILVIDQGRVVERGNHESLLKDKGTYARLFTLQAKGYQ
ncbi:ABC transporter, ATP-binding [gamma proteobacterium IMCC1989]|nr:ABC transporter, ATP-binding [gamma proteobacterium IMCC1989]